MRPNTARRAGIAAIAVGVAAATVIVTGSLDNESSAAVNWSTAKSASAGGGMGALVKAAKAEGKLNVIALPTDWANYGKIMKAFTKKYGIKITDANPDGSSADELTAIKTGKGQPSAPDVVDVGTAYAFQGAIAGDFAPYKVSTWKAIPGALKDAGGLYFSDYGGYMSIGCDSAKVSKCPTSFAQLDSPAYKGQVALNGDPTAANAAFMGVWSAAMANGGSVNNIQPGIDFFKKLNADGDFNKTQVSPATIASGATPIAIDWDYLNAAVKTGGLKSWKVAIPKKGSLPGFYDQAVSRYAPHPAAARLWEEFLYSQAKNAGQNLFLESGARPAEQAAMTKNHTINAKAAAALPPAPKASFSPTYAQYTKAQNTVVKNWAAAVN